MSDILFVILVVCFLVVVVCFLATIIMMSDLFFVILVASIVGAVVGFLTMLIAFSLFGREVESERKGCKIKITKGDIAQLLDERNVTFPCARCEFTGFAVEGFTDIEVTQDPNFFYRQRSGRKELLVPVVVVSCGRCGDITFHALGSLGLLEDWNRRQSVDSSN